MVLDCTNYPFPEEVWANIFEFLPHIDAGNTQSVHSEFYAIFKKYIPISHAQVEHTAFTKKDALKTISQNTLFLNPDILLKAIAFDPFNIAYAALHKPAVIAKAVKEAITHIYLFKQSQHELYEATQTVARIIYKDKVGEEFIRIEKELQDFELNVQSKLLTPEYFKALSRPCLTFSGALHIFNLTECKKTIFRDFAENIRDDLDIAQKAIQLDPENFTRISPLLQNDRSFVHALKIESIFQYLSEPFRNDPKTALKAIGPSSNNIQHLGSDLISDIKFITQAVQKTPQCFESIPKKFKNDLELVLLLCAPYIAQPLDSVDKIHKLEMLGFILPYVGPDIKSSAIFFESICGDHYGSLLQYANTQLKQDINFVQKICRLSYEAYPHADTMVRNNFDFALEICTKHPEYLEYALERLEDNAFVKALLKINPDFLAYIPDWVPNYRDLVIDTINQDGLLIRFAQIDIFDFDLLIIACQQNPKAIVNIPHNIKKHQLASLIRKVPQSYQYLYAPFRDCHLVTQAAVSQNGMLLEFASHRVRNDRDVVNTAIQQNKDAIQFAGNLYLKYNSPPKMSTDEQKF